MSNKIQIGVPGRRYGLVHPKTKKKPGFAVNSLGGIFGVDSDEETKSSPHLPSAGKQKNFQYAKRQRIADKLRSVEEENPDIFKYDEHLESFSEKREKTKNDQEIEKQNRPVRYINRMKKVSKLREIDNEMAYNRREAREREKEGNLYEGKAKYITGAYREKLKIHEAFKRNMELERAQEERNDVTKKDSLVDFQKNLLNRREEHYQQQIQSAEIPRAKPEPTHPKHKGESLSSSPLPHGRSRSPFERNRSKNATKTDRGKRSRSGSPKGKTAEESKFISPERKKKTTKDIDDIRGRYIARMKARKQQVQTS